MTTPSQVLTPDIQSKCEKLNIGKNTHHIFFCAGPKCVDESVGADVWDHLKARVNQEVANGIKILRTKTVCLRICREGPVALVYPSGTWYAGVDKKVCDRIIDEHIKGGQPVESHIIASAPLP